MKPNAIKQWAVLLLTVSGMTALPPTTSAFRVATDTTESNKTYVSDGNWAALQLVNNITYTGSNINASSTYNSGWGPQFGVYTQAQNQLLLQGGTITTSGSSSSAYAIFLDISSGGTLANLTVRTTGASACGVFVYRNSWIYASQLDISTSGSHAVGVKIDNSSRGVLQDATINTSGMQGYGIQINGNCYLEATNVTINTTGSWGHLMQILSSTAVFTNLNASSRGENGGAAFSIYGNSGLTVSGGIITSENNGISAYGNSNITLNDVSLNGGKLLWWGAASASTTLTANHSELIGNLKNDLSVVSGELIFNLNDSAFTGDTNINNNFQVTINSSNSTILGDVTGSGSSTLNINASNSVLIGDIIAADDAVLTVNLDNASELTGKIDPVDLSVKNNSTWNMTADSQVNNLLINSGGKIIFQKDASSFKTLAVTNISGRGEFHMNTDIAANQGDLLTVSGDSDGAHRVL
ncbi:MAG: hypothetical protein LBD30_06485, partial [Verrucomicrobiales bacterium]|nr:hypothetical protein [Verrucomicrobiales bacterium]